MGQQTLAQPTPTAAKAVQRHRHGMPIIHHAGGHQNRRRFTEFHSLSIIAPPKKRRILNTVKNNTPIIKFKLRSVHLFANVGTQLQQ